MTTFQFRGSQPERERAAILRTPLLRRNRTKAQIETFIDNNVTDLASTKEVLKTIAFATLVIARSNS